MIASTLQFASLLAALLLGAGDAARVELVTDSAVSPPVRHGVETLQAALDAKGFQVRRGTAVPADAQTIFLVGLSQGSGAAARCLECQGLNVPQQPESLLVRPLAEPGCRQFLIAVPEYPQVRAKGLSDAERRRNLRMLRTISRMAADYGIDFVLAVWMHLPRYATTAGASTVENLPEYPRDYSAKALAAVLRACPEIRGLQFRINDESGIAEKQQTDFYGALFQAARDCGRPIRLDLRLKGLKPETSEAALRLGLDVTLSTKFWSEQMGLPYHPTVEDTVYRHGRYGYADMLRHPRPYHVQYQLWTVGTHRVLLWGDPQYGAQFARSCLLGGRGFEVFAPLGNKGYGNAPGTWRILADRSLEFYRYEQQQYWMFYLVFGRTGYDPQVSPSEWEREFRQRFGPAGPAVEAAYRAASQVLPFLTAVRLNSASEWRTWPEIEPGYNLETYARVVPSDTAQFYGIRTWARVRGWRSETWAPGIPGYVDDALAGKLRPMWTPFHVGRHLHELSARTQASLDEARRLAPAPRDPEFRGTQLDLGVLARLAEFHAEKMLAATHVEIFKDTQQAGRLPVARDHMRRAVRAWEEIVGLTDGAYHSNLVFGFQDPTALRTGYPAMTTPRQSVPSSGSRTPGLTRRAKPQAA
jgi:hypothetical protein